MLHGRKGLGETLDIAFWTKWDVGSVSVMVRNVSAFGGRK